MPTYLPADVAHCTSLTADEWAAFLASPIRVGRMALGQFILNTTTQALYQKRARGTGSGTMVEVGGGSAALPAGLVGFGNPGGTAITSDGSFGFSPSTKMVTAAAVEATTFVQFKGGTAFYMRLAGAPTANRVWTFPDVASDTVMLVNAAQAPTNKSFVGATNGAAGFDAVTNNAPVEMFPFEARGANGAGAGAAGLAARVPFRAANSAGTATRAGGLEAGWLATPTAGSEAGYTALLGAYAGTVYPVIRAVVPGAVAAYQNGLQVQGQTMGANPILSPFGDGASLGLDFTAVGDGVHRFYGAGDRTLAAIGRNASNNNLAEVFRLTHQTTAGVAASGMGAYQMFGVVDQASLATDLGAVIGRVANATVGAIQGSMEIRVADGTGGLPGAGLFIEGEGAAVARDVGLQIFPGAFIARLSPYGSPNAQLDIRGTGTGIINITPSDGVSMIQVALGPPRKLNLGNLSTDVVALYNGGGSVQMAHQANLPAVDVTNPIALQAWVDALIIKYNLLLAFLQARGDQAV